MRQAAITNVATRCVGGFDVEVLSGLADEVSNLDAGSGRDVHAVIERADTPIRIQVSGRSGVGRTTVVRALGSQTGTAAVETGGVDTPGRDDPRLDADVVVYVLAESVRAPDQAALAQVDPNRAVAVLNKADALSHSWADAVNRADECSAALGVPTFPLIGTVTTSLREHGFTNEDLQALQGAAPDDATRDRLLARWERFGVDCVREGVRRGQVTDTGTAEQILHAVSGLDAVRRGVESRIRAARARRAAVLLRELAAITAPPRVRDTLDRFLGSDAAVDVAATAARHGGELAGPALARIAEQSAETGAVGTDTATAAEAMHHALSWRELLAGELTARQRRAALAVHRGYVRQWARLSAREQGR